MVDGECVGLTQVGSYYLVYAVQAFTLYYALPSIILIIFYGMVIITLRRRMSDKTFGTSAAFEKASVKVKCFCCRFPIVGHFYRPQMKLRKGNVFTPVCQSFCSHSGEVYTLP